MTIGNTNPLPFIIGDEPSPMEAAYSSLRSMVGVNGSGPEGSIESDWRWSKSLALGAFATFGERAALQCSPATASDFLEVFESLFGIEENPLLGDAERAETVTTLYTSTPETWHAELSATLLLIDPRISLLYREWDQEDTTIDGRIYEPRVVAAAERFSASTYKMSQFPNFSSAFEVVVLFNLGNGMEPSAPDAVKMTTIADTLNSILPGWVTFSTLCTDEGFVLDFSLLDVTACHA